MALIEVRIGLVPLVAGTLNVAIPEDYIVAPDAIITPEEYGHPEMIKLQRCLLNGHNAIIMRPDTHEVRPNYGHGRKCLELMGRIHFRTALGLDDGDEVAIEVEGDDEWWASGL